MALVVLAGFLVLAIVGTIYGIRAQGLSLARLEHMQERTLVLDRQGDPMGHVYGHGENRLIVSLEEISPFFIEAILAREDSRFYRHGGVDWIGVIRASMRNAREQRIVQGASTITMQLARNSFGMMERTFDRKLLEVALALRIERRYSKDEILELYVNRIYFGSGLYGIERAAQGYFMKPARDLKLGEATLLAGIIRGPSQFSPFRSLEAATAQRDETLERLVRTRRITEEEAEEARSTALAIRPPEERTASPGYVIQEVFLELERFLDEAWIQQGGLRVHTTIDNRLQETARVALTEHLAEIETQPGFPHPPMSPGPTPDRLLETPYVQGAVVALDNATAGILALVGGRDFDDSPFNRATSARRQIGSTFKPFVYAEGFASGLKPGTFVSDGPLSLPGAGGRPWRPENSDGTFGGMLPAATGLVRSRNTMTIRVGMDAGVAPVVDLANRLGLSSLDSIPASPVSFLGAFETDPLSLASAYSVFPSRGLKRRPFLIDKIVSPDGEVLFASTVLQHRVLSESVAYVASDVLAAAIDEGTGQRARELGFTAPAGGKTGTTNDYVDAWFAGFTDRVTCAVWVGLDQPKTIQARGYGSTLALPVWTRLMIDAEAAGYAGQPLPVPANLVEVTFCRECGLRAERRSTDPYTMLYPEDLVGAEPCAGHRGVLTGTRETRSAAGSPIKALGRFLFGPRK